MNAFKLKKLNIKSILVAVITAVFLLTAFILLFKINTLHSVALEQTLRCGIEAHTHTDDCYNEDFLVCKKASHAHDSNCYIVLLADNDINNVLTLIEDTEPRSLEYMITDVVSEAITLNDDINKPSEKEEEPQKPLTLTEERVVMLNTTILDEASLPNIVLNENINNISTLALENGNNSDTTNATLNATTNSVGNSGISTLAVGDEPSTSNNNANFYIYLDDEWTCIGTLTFSTSSSGWWSYNSTISTNSILNLVNSTLGTSYDYNSFDIAVSSQENSGYSIRNIGMAEGTTTIGYQQSSSNARAAKYVRLIPNGATNANSTAFAFNTVKYKYPDGIESTVYVRSGSSITLPDGNYEWSDGSKTYNSEDSVEINDPTTFTATLLGPVNFINVHYNVNFPTVSGVSVATKPTISGQTTTTLTDGFTENSSATVRNVSQQTVEGKVDDNSTNLSRVVQFKGWKINGTNTILQPNTTLVWEELLQYESGATINLSGVWEYNALQTASFFVRFDSVAVDTEGNVTGQDQNKYTKELFSAYVGGVDVSLGDGTLNERYHIVDTTTDNSFGADQAIRALYGEKNDGVWLSAFPNDDYIFEELKHYAQTGYLSVDGVPVKVEDLNNSEYAIRWYVFKCQSDAWHIDGKLVKKEGLIHVYKTFAGNKELVELAKSDFYIDALDVTANTNTVLNLDNYTTYNEATDTYMWEIKNVDYGEEWSITEHPHKFDESLVDSSVYSEYTVMDAHGDQSITGAGTSLTVTGMTYALDEGKDEVLRAEFTNIYNKKNSIVIKKQDSLTGVSIGGATFQLLQNGTPLKFNYNSKTNSYEHDQQNGTKTILEGTENGYFEIQIEDISYDKGPIVVREIDQPTGYSPIGDIEIGYTADDEIGILSGNSELTKYIDGILIVGNSTDASKVTVNKEWECPENEWQDVKVQLLANGKLVTTVITGVKPEVVLNNDNNWTYTWDNLPVYVNGEKIEWSVKEVQIGTETPKSDGSFINWLVAYGLPIHSTDDDGNEHTTFTITNTTKRVMLRLTKTDFKKILQLKGASFLLEAVDKDGNVLTSEISKNATTGDNGTLIFDNLKCAVRYRLTETVAPEGYVKTSEYIYFTINEDGTVVVEDNFYAEAGSTAYNIIVRNAEGVPLPESGGAGTYMFYAIGLTLLMLAISIYIIDILKNRGCRN